jgi:Ca2+-binding EF-hand superfamily protein
MEEETAATAPESLVIIPRAHVSLVARLLLPVPLEERLSAAAAAALMNFLSQAQAKEVRELFTFLDTDHDGLLDVCQGINLCRQLGFNVDASTLQHTEQHVSIKDLLGWCEAFVAKCAHSEDLHLTQMFQLLSQRHIGGSEGITGRGLRRYLADEKLSFPPEQAPSRAASLNALACTHWHAHAAPWCSCRCSP